MTNKKIYRGFTDEASFHDYFEIERYTNGLTKFIANCNTPMTVSVQGSWGTGKTSVMNIVQQELETIENDDIQTIWFNTWKFSQFNMQDNLATSLLTCLIDELKVSSESKKIASKMAMGLQLAGEFSKHVLLSVLEEKAGTAVKGGVERILDKATGSDENLNPIHAINNFREKFTECVRETGKERIVVFIDDLDRLEPRKAIEILEVLKLFLDCPNCVFVLAIDYDVVLQGVNAKYGQLSKDEKSNEKKGKEFFDKIIQVPFKMPIANYNITKYIKQCFEELEIAYSSESELSVYETLIKTSIGTNPRAMKRMFNAFLLLTGMLPEEKDMITMGAKQLLFGTLCLQHCDEDVYNYIVSNRSILDGYSLTLLLGNEDEMQELPNLDVLPDQIYDVQPFMKVLFDLIGRDKNGNINENRYKDFVNILELSSVTATAASSTTRGQGQIIEDISSLNFDGGNVDKIKEILSLINGIGDKSSAIMYNQGSGMGMIYGVVNDGKRNRFVESFSRKNGYRLECIVKNKNYLETADDHILNIISKDGWKVSGKKITYTVTAKKPEIMSDVKTIMSFAYGSWCE